MNLSEHFTLAEMTRSETAARKGLLNMPPAEVIEVLRYTCAKLEDIRLKSGPLHVLSGYRSDVVNRAVGGAKNSQHRYGEAADIVSGSLSQPELFELIRATNAEFDQLIDEFGEWVHVSFVQHREPRHEVLRARRTFAKTVYSRVE